METNISIWKRKSKDPMRQTCNKRVVGKSTHKRVKTFPHILQLRPIYGLPCTPTFFNPTKNTPWAKNIFTHTLGWGYVSHIPGYIYIWHAGMWPSLIGQPCCQVSAKTVWGSSPQNWAKTGRSYGRDNPSCIVLKRKSFIRNLVSKWCVINMVSEILSSITQKYLWEFYYPKATPPRNKGLSVPLFRDNGGDGGR